MNPCSFPPLMLALGILLIGRLDAQTIKFDAANLAFFQNKAERYQRWLNQTGLGTALRVTKVRLKKDSTELELLLRANSTDLDTAIALWNRAKDDYNLSTGQPLEEKPFQTFVASMEIPPEQGNVQVYVLDAGGASTPCFCVGIWEENGHHRTESRMRKCKDKPLDIQLRPLPPAQKRGRQNHRGAAPADQRASLRPHRGIPARQVHPQHLLRPNARTARGTAYQNRPAHQYLQPLPGRADRRKKLDLVCRLHK